MDTKDCVPATVQDRNKLFLALQVNHHVTNTGKSKFPQILLGPSGYIVSNLIDENSIKKRESKQQDKLNILSGILQLADKRPASWLCSHHHPATVHQNGGSHRQSHSRQRSSGPARAGCCFNSGHLENDAFYISIASKNIRSFTFTMRY